MHYSPKQDDRPLKEARSRGAGWTLEQSRCSMESPLDVLLSREDLSNGRTVLKGHSPSLQGLRSSSQQVVVPACSTGRSANFKLADSSSTADRVTQLPAANPSITVLLPKERLNDSTLLLSPLLFLSNETTQAKSSVSSKGPLTHAEKSPLISTKGTTEPDYVDSVGLDTDCSTERVRNDRGSSVEAEDSLGSLLSKHFEPNSNDDGALVTSPDSEIAKQRLLLGRAKIRHVCEVCNRECPSKHKLRRHLSTHSKERPFTCQVCGKTFKWTEYLQKHIRQQHSNGVEVSPTSPLSPTSTQPSLANSSTTSPPTSPTPLAASSKSSRVKSVGQKKLQKQNPKNKRKKSKSQSETATTKQECPLHSIRAKSQETSSVELVSVESSEQSNSSKVTTDKETNQNFTESLLVSIPKMQNASIGVNMDEEQITPKTPSTSSNVMDALDITLEKINASTSPGETVLASSFSTAVSAVMAEPIPSNCIGSNGGVISSMTIESSTQVQTVGGSRAGNLSQSQAFSQDFQHCFALNSTANNNSDSMLTQDFSHHQVLNTDSSDQYTPGLMQQINPSRDHPVLSASSSMGVSGSNSMDVSSSHSINVSGSHSMQMVSPTDSLSFPMQQDGHANLNSISHSLLTQSQLPINLSSSDSIQPPNLIPVNNSQFPMQPQHNHNMVLEQQNLLQNMTNFTYSDGGLASNRDVNSQYFAGSFDGDSLMDGMGMSSGLDYPMQMSPELMCDATYQSAPSYLDIQQARQLLYENTQQMKRILKSYQSLQNTLLRVTAGAEAAMLPTTYNGFMNGQGFQQYKDHMMHQQPIDNDHMTQMQDHMIHQQMNDNSQMAQMQQPIDQQISHQLTDETDHMTQPQDHMMQQPQSHDTPTPQISDHMIQPQPTSETPCPLPIEQVQTTDDFDSPSLISCDPSELLTPVIEEDESLSPPPEKRARLDTASGYDIGIQCELGPETIQALIEEELSELHTEDVESIELSADSQESPDPNELDQTKMDRIVNKYPCEVDGCKRAYVHRKDLTRHMKIRHGVLPKTLKPVAVETAEKPYVCPLNSCGRSYYHMRDLRRHQRACHSVNSQSEIDDQSNLGKGQMCENNGLNNNIQLRYPCDFPGCVRSYIHKKDLVRHKRLYHKDTSSKPSVPNPIPYSDTDHKVFRQEIKSEKTRLDSTSSAISSSTSIGSDTSGILCPDSLLSTFNTDVLASLGITPPSVEIDKDLAEIPVSASAAQLISLIQTLTTTSTPPMSQLGDFPQFRMLPVIPIVTENAGLSTATNTVPLIPNTKNSSVKATSLKEVLSEPSSLSKLQNGTNLVDSSRGTTELPPAALSISNPKQTGSINGLESLLEYSTQELMSSSLKEQTQRDKDSLAQHSPESLASLAAGVLSTSESDLSTVLMRTVSSSPGMPISFSASLLAVDSLNENPPTEQRISNTVLTETTPPTLYPSIDSRSSDEPTKGEAISVSSPAKQILSVESTFASKERVNEPDISTEVKSGLVNNCQNPMNIDTNSLSC